MAQKKASKTKKKALKAVAPKLDGFDLDSAIAEVADTEDTTPFSFSYRGEEWTMRSVSDSDAKLMANIELNEVQQMMSYLRDLLGDEQWERFPRISYNAAMLLIERYADDAVGVSLGESEALTD